MTTITPDVVIPDSIVPVEGWKALDYGDGRLWSPSQTTLWPPNKRLAAECPYAFLSEKAYTSYTPMTGGIPFAEWVHSPPGPRCGCGIYIAAQKPLALRYLNKDYTPRGSKRRFPVLAKVKGWGRTIPGENGWRTEFCYPTELIALGGTPDDHRQMEQLYGVPVKTSSKRRQLFKQFARAFFRKPRRFSYLRIWIAGMVIYNIVMFVIFGGWVYPVSAIITGLTLLVLVTFDTLLAINN